MAELLTQERLQPSLLDRLTDDEPDKQQESRERRVLSMSRLRQVVLRDLEWLLNTTQLDDRRGLADFPFVATSVINYGVPDLTGTAASGLNPEEIASLVRQAILDFEPRILRQTVRVHAVVSPDEMSRNTVAFEIEGELWAQPVPLQLFLKTEVDLETGHCTVRELFGRGVD
jgi:type VI secretion system protein ImpF